MADVLLGHSRPMHSVPVPINVRCYSNSDIIVRRSEVTLRAIRRHQELSLDFDCAGDGVHSARELHQRAVAHELDDTTRMDGNRWIDINSRRRMFRRDNVPASSVPMRRE